MTKYAINKKVFSKITKERGEKYYKQGLVGDLFNVNSNIYSNINNYLTILGPEIIYCSCPCDDYCKHLYSLLLKINNEDVPENLINRLHQEKTKNELINILLKIVDKCTTKTIKILQIINNPDEEVSTDDSDINY